MACRSGVQDQSCHVFDPLDFVSRLATLLSPSGLLLVTGLGGDGFDIVTLGEKSKAVFPPHHLNFLSVAGFEKLFRRAGLSQAEVETPGKLDVDIVRNSGISHPFLEKLAERGESALAEFQHLLVRNKLSSHVWIYGRR